MKEIEIKRDGLILRGIYQDFGKDRPLMIICHGFTASYHHFDPFFPMLEKQKISYLAFDFNGHGKSDGNFTDMNVFNEIEDGIKVLEYVKTLKYSKLFLLGHSQGGVVASMLAGYYKDIFDGLILMAPAATLKDDAIKGTLMGTSYDPNHIPDTVTPARHSDYVVGGHYFRIAQLLPIYEVAKEYTGPVCIIHGNKDTVVDKKASVKYDDCYKNSILHIIVGEDHSMTIHTNDDYRIVLDFIKSEE